MSKKEEAFALMAFFSMLFFASGCNSQYSRARNKDWIRSQLSYPIFDATLDAADSIVLIDFTGKNMVYSIPDKKYITRDPESFFPSQPRPPISGEVLKKASCIFDRVELSFVGAKLKDDAWSELGNCKLIALRLSGSNVTDTDLKLVLQSQNDLLHLDLSNTSISDDSIAMILALPNLTHLNLSATKVSNIGLAHLAKHERLLNVVLTNTSVTDEGVVLYVALGGTAQLQIKEYVGIDGGVI